MLQTASTSSSPNDDERLTRISLDRLHPHPANANVMPDELLQKLARNIERQRRYPPLVVRPHPRLDGHYELLDGHQRADVLRELGHADAVCFVWPCDDETALVLLATLNRLEGADVPGRRAALLQELSALMPPEELALLLPEDGAEIESTMSLIELDPEALLAELTAAADQGAATGPRLISFAVERDDEPEVEEAITQAMKVLEGRNRRGRALAAICRAYLEGING